MSEPFLGEIRYLGFTFAPRGWAPANGAMVSLRQQAGLFALMGTAFGGDGVNTFQLPNLVGRQVCSQGQGPGGLSDRAFGEAFGTSTVSLTQAEMAMHSHTIAAYDGAPGQTAAPASNGTSGLGASDNSALYCNPTGTTLTFAPNAISVGGNGLPHDNTQPILALMSAICLSGVYPAFQ